VLDREYGGRSKPAGKPASGFYRARSFREVEILVERVRFATVLLGGIAGAMFIWFQPDALPQDARVEARAEPCTPFPATQALSRITQSSAVHPALAASSSIAPETDLAHDRLPASQQDDADRALLRHSQAQR
jgi:hypothetical protein